MLRLLSVWIKVTGTPGMTLPDESETTPSTSATATAWACSPAGRLRRQTTASGNAAAVFHRSTEIIVTT